MPHPARSASRTSPDLDVLQIGSIGYEQFALVTEFARHLREAGVGRLIDVRQLPISRRRGFAKTALSVALAEEGIEYVHMKELGNPKHLRDLYKSGNSDEGRRLYVDHLAENGGAALDALEVHVRERPCALMCFEHDVRVCHRHVIFEALSERVDEHLEVTEIAER